MPRLSLLLILLVSLPASGLAQAVEPRADMVVTYDQVRPVFRKRCVTCHNTERPRGELDLSTFDAIQAGSGSGPVAVANKADESMLYTVVAHLEEPFMPPNSPKIPQREIDLIRHWIEGGMVERTSPASPREGSGTSPAVAVAPTRPARSVAPAISAVAALPRATAITALAISPAAPLMAISGNRQAALLSLEAQKPLRAFDFPEGDVFSLKFSVDGTLLLIGGGTGGLSGKVVGVEVSTGKRVFDLGDETDVVLAADLTPDKQLVAFGGPGRTVKVFRTSDGQQVATLRKHTDWILSLAFSPDGLLLASGDRFGGLQVWEAESGKEFFTLRGHTGPVNSLGWSADGERLLSGGQDGTLRWWEMHRGTQLSQWQGQAPGVLAVQVLPDNQILCGGRGRKLTLFSGPERSEHEVTLHDEIVELAVTKDGKLAVAADVAGQIAVVSLADGAISGEFSLPVDPQLVRQPGPVSRHVVNRRPANPALAAAEAQARQLAAELLETREALAAAESAVQSAEQALARSREAADKLRQLLSRQAAAAQQAASRAESLRTPAP